MSHVRIEPKTNLRSPADLPDGIQFGPVANGGIDYPFSAVLCLDDVALMHVQQDDADQPTLRVLLSLASKRLRVFDPGVPENLRSCHDRRVPTGTLD